MWRMLLLTFCLLVSGVAPAQMLAVPAHVMPAVQTADPCSHCHDAAPAPAHHAAVSPCCDNTFCTMTPGALVALPLTAPYVFGTAVREAVLPPALASWQAAPPLPPPRTLA